MHGADTAAAASEDREVIADGIDGPTIIYTDGTSEFFPADPKDLPAPPQTGDINFEDRTGGFEVWH